MSDFEYLPPEVSTLLSNVDACIIWEHEHQPPRGHEVYHPSAFGNCLRLMQYQRYEERGLVKGEKKKPSPDLCRIWGNGHSMHDRWRGYFETMGVLRGYWQCSNPFCGFWGDDGELISTNFNELYKKDNQWGKRRRVHGTNNLQGCFKPDRCVCGCKKFKYEEVDVVNKELNFSGHADIILDFSIIEQLKAKEIIKVLNLNHIPTKPIVVDMKSINHFYYQDVAKGNPHKYYLTQLMIYINILQCEYGVLIYENKNNQKSCAFKVNARSEDLYPHIVKTAKIMNEMTEVVDENGEKLNLLPPPKAVFKDEESDICKYCEYTKLCYSSPIWDDPDIDQIRKDFYGDI